MRISASLTIQFMMKHKVTDMPRMSSVKEASFDHEVTIPTELEPYVPIYLASESHYDVDKNTLAIWKKKVKKAYPDMWEKFVMKDGSTTQLKPTSDEIMDAAFCMTIEDVLNEYAEQNIDKIIEENHIEVPVDSDEYYYADKFVHLGEWSAVEKRPE